MIIISLFDGISCGRIALERAGIKVDKYFASEIDKNAIKVSKDNWPDIIQIGDVTKVKWADGILYTENGNFECPNNDLMVIGGSPCQGFSVAGKGLNFEDPRSKLFFELVRIKEETKCKYFFLENNKMKKKEWEDKITEVMGVNPVNICSSYFSAQNRDRLYWTNIQGFKIPAEKSSKVLEDIIDKNETANFINISEDKIKRRGDRYIQWDLNGTGNMSQDQRGYRLSAKSGALTCYTSNGKILLEDGRIRQYSAVEYERLQTLDDGYTKALKSKSAKVHAIGNGWTVDVIVEFFKHLKNG